MSDTHGQSPNLLFISKTYHKYLQFFISLLPRHMSRIHCLECVHVRVWSSQEEETSRLFLPTIQSPAPLNAVLFLHSYHWKQRHHWKVTCKSDAVWPLHHMAEDQGVRVRDVSSGKQTRLLYIPHEPKEGSSLYLFGTKQLPCSSCHAKLKVRDKFSLQETSSIGIPCIA